MYSKVYNITYSSGQRDALLDHYDTHIAPVVSESPRHVGHQMVEVSAEHWILISNYHSKTDAEESLQMVRDLVAPMAEKYGMTLEVIGEGETVREVS